MNAFDYRQRLESALWRRREPGLSRWRLMGLRLARTVAALIRDNTRSDLALRAMGLVYTTLLSLVPLLALSFSILKAFGVHNQIRPLLLGVLAPLGDSSREVAERIVTFIDNMNVGVLGSMGLAFLLFTAVSLVQKVEEAFNFIWHISRPRSFGERFSRYLTLLLVGPTLVFSALGLTASAMNADLVREMVAFEPLGHMVVAVGHLTPYLLVMVAFSVAYYFIPNTRVRMASALIGAVVAGTAWQTAGWAFAEFAASSRQYQAVYSSFAILILFMTWLYLSWRIVLFGASVAFYYQCPEYLAARGSEPRVSERMKEKLVLAAMGALAEAFVAGSPPPSAEALAHGLSVPEPVLAPLLDELEKRGLVRRVVGTPSGYLPARALSTLPLLQVVDAVRSAGDMDEWRLERPGAPLRVSGVAGRIDEALARSLAGLTVADLVRSDDGEPPG
ncbi:MAG TPA: YhjD/YihY/BrkB family envelope integrity protein [Rhodocyclaceae bacterium]|nr:YhjD/YihY/BrkB family envelope integrity protein [Rhodocyclaceae bacterium]